MGIAKRVMVIVCAAALAWAGLLMPAASAAVRCDAATFPVMVNGVVKCLPRSVVRASPSATLQGLLTSQVGLASGPQPKLKKGIPMPVAISAADAAKLARAAQLGSDQARAALNTRLLPPKAARSARVEASEDGVTLGKPVTRVTKQTDTEVEGSVAVDGTVDASGKKFSVELTLGGKARSGDEAPPEFKVGVKVATEEPDGAAKLAKSFGFNVTTGFPGSEPQVCPTSDGKIEASQFIKYSQSESLAGQIGPLKLASFAKETGISFNWNAKAQTDPNSRLASITYSLSSSLHSRADGNILFYKKGSGFSVEMRASGTLNPVTGVPNAGSRMQVKASSYGIDPVTPFDGSAQASDLLQSALTEMWTKIRTVEANARAGKCTDAVLLANRSTADVTLAPGETFDMDAELRATSDIKDGEPDLVATRWEFTPSTGSVTPRDSSLNRPKITVTGGPRDRTWESVDMQVTGYSRRGISTLHWTALESPALKLAVTSAPATFNALSQKVQLVYTVTNDGGIPLDRLSVLDALGDPVTCAKTALPPKSSTTCTATHTVSRANLDALRFTSSARASAHDHEGSGDVPTVSPQKTLVVTGTAPKHGRITGSLAFTDSGSEPWNGSRYFGSFPGAKQWADSYSAQVAVEFDEAERSGSGWTFGIKTDQGSMPYGFRDAGSSGSVQVHRTNTWFGTCIDDSVSPPASRDAQYSYTASGAWTPRPRVTIYPPGEGSNRSDFLVGFDMTGLSFSTSGSGTAQDCNTSVPPTLEDPSGVFGWPSTTADMMAGYLIWNSEGTAAQAFAHDGTPMGGLTVQFG